MLCSMFRFALLPALALTLGCTDPRQACLSEATRDLGTIRALIADTEATVRRGYAIETEERTRIFTTFCLGNRTSNVGLSVCNSSQPVISRRPVAVDIGEERRKLASLQVRERELRASTASEIQRCELAYPAT